MATTVNIPAISTLGVKFGYAVETTAGTKPEKFIWIPRCTEIGEIPLDTETIDASALEDKQSRYIPGRQDTGGEWNVTFFITPETRPLIKKMMTDSSAGQLENKRTWYEVWNPNDEEAVYVIGQPGSKIPFSGASQNEAYSGTLSIAIDEYREYETAIEPELEGDEV